MRKANLKAGRAVVGNSGRRPCAVRDVGQDHLLVSRGAFSGHLYVPASAIVNVEHEVGSHLLHRHVDHDDTARVEHGPGPRRRMKAPPAPDVPLLVLTAHFAEMDLADPR